MAALSNKSGDLIKWAERVIDSCETPLQEITAKKLVRLVEDRLRQEKLPDELVWAVHRNLRGRLDNKVYQRLK